MPIDTGMINNIVEQIKDPNLLDSIVSYIQTHAVGLPTGAVALVALYLGLKLKKLVFKIIGLALVAAALVFFVMRQ